MAMRPYRNGQLARQVSFKNAGLRGVGGAGILKRRKRIQRMRKSRYSLIVTSVEPPCGAPGASMKRSIVPVSLMLGLLVLAAPGCNLLKKGASDQAITSDIQAKLFQDPVLKTRDIRVNTDKGVVTLAGTVNTDLEKAAVERFANQENGVKQVVDQLTVGSAASAAVTPATPPPAPATAPPPAAPASHPKARKKHAREVVASNPSPAPEPPAAPPANPGPAPVVDQPPMPAAPPPPQPVTVTIPAGTTVSVRMIDGVDSSVNQPGQEFSASLSAPVAVGSQVVIPANSNATVRLVNAKSSGRFEGSAQLALQLTSIAVNGTSYNVQSSTFQQAGSSRGKRTAEAVGAGAVIGGLIGAIAGGGKGAAIGAGVGAGTGTGVEAASKKGQVKVPSETKIDFILKAPLTVTLSQ
jgi:BON domain